jgi:uncharacterized protein HemX
METIMLLSLIGSKNLIYVGAALAAVTLLTGVYLFWKRSIELEALQDFNRQQLEQTVRDQELFRQRQSELEEQQRIISRNLAAENNRLRTRVESIQGVLSSQEAIANDRPASDILRQTIDELRNLQQ